MQRHPRTARLLCDFDSSVAAVRAMSRVLQNRAVGSLGLTPGSRMLADAAARLPSAARRRAFLLAASQQGAPAAKVRRLRSEDLSAWTADKYGPGPFPAVFIGSVSGAALHLAAALRAPVLPQTYLVPVRARLDPDQPTVAMAAGRGLGASLAADNPDLSLCHMHDPNQDRAMIVRFMYFRFKRLRLGTILRRFLEERLAPGATIYVVDCGLTWPATRLGERHRFQFGALGGMEPQEYTSGSERVARHLAEQGSEVRRWQAPATDLECPEAEWGYDNALTPDLLEVAARCGYRVRRIRVDEPEHLSPLVAELHRWWYARHGLPAGRLLAETYNQWEPHWVPRVGAVPFWLQFTTRPSYRTLTRYLCEAEPYRHVHANLFSNAVRSVGLVPAERWRDLARRYASGEGGLLGVDEDAFPEDIGSTLRYGPAVASLPRTQPPPALSVAEFDAFLSSVHDSEVCRGAQVEPVETEAP